jgi:hypothetical protein
MNQYLSLSAVLSLILIVASMIGGYVWAECSTDCCDCLSFCARSYCSITHCTPECRSADQMSCVNESCLDCDPYKMTCDESGRGKICVPYDPAGCSHYTNCLCY